MRNSGNAIDRADEFLPAISLRGQNSFAGWRQAIVAPSTLSRLLDPSSPDPTALLQPVKERIQRRDVKSQDSARTQLDQLADVVACRGRSSTSDRINNSALPFFNSRSSIGEDIYAYDIYLWTTQQSKEIHARRQSGKEAPSTQSFSILFSARVDWPGH